MATQSLWPMCFRARLMPIAVSWGETSVTDFGEHATKGRTRRGIRPFVGWIYFPGLCSAALCVDLGPQALILQGALHEAHVNVEEESGCLAGLRIRSRSRAGDVCEADGAFEVGDRRRLVAVPRQEDMNKRCAGDWGLEAARNGLGVIGIAGFVGPGQCRRLGLRTCNGGCRKIRIL